MMRFALAALAVSTTNCASVNVKAPQDLDKYVEENRDDMGVVYYEPMFVLVVSCKKDGVHYTIETLPDYNRPRVVEWSNGWFGSAHPSLTLGGGWRLDAIDAESDSGGGAVVEAIGGLGAAALGILKGVDGGAAPSGMAPGIYRLAWSAKKHGWTMHEEPLAKFGDACVVTAP